MAEQTTIYEVLEQEHRQVSELLQRMQRAEDADERMTLFAQISQELISHAEAESKSFYAALRPVLDRSLLSISLGASTSLPLGPRTET